MSRQQPFCDGSHFQTKFKPVKFLLEDPRESINLCGCKLSTRAPFCDGETCLKIRNGEEIVAPLHQSEEETPSVVEAESSSGPAPNADK